ncbi:hypothetical protein [Streptomyces kebangsaanensis]|uniref:hypothetical protein n=1 Tax=Streptomyces kebangsaanensis TaxID=864058 RepID=UPI00093D809B|nr:hypothetical protein [Streptomyces kebangsaanensis]
MSNTTSKPARQRRRPDDSPFDYNLDAVEPKQELTPFVVQYQGKRWTFCHMQELDCWDLLEAARDGQVGAMLGAFKAALGDQFDAFRALHMPQYKLQPLFRAWQRHCGMNEDGTPINDPDDTSD